MRYVLLALLFTSVVFGQSFVIKGYVIDDETEASLAKASIILNNSKQGAIADSSGAFRISYNPGVDTRVRISFVGYQQQEIVLSKTGDMDCVVRMLRSTMPAQSVLVTATLGNELLPMTTYNKMNKAEIVEME